MPETWAHRADLAESAINERHASRLWGLPRTNLAVVSWPPTTKEKLFGHWHYWWQAHYIDCQVDAALRRETKTRRRRISDTIRGVKIRNLGRLTKNRYFDDKAWMALAMNRAGNLNRFKQPKQLDELEFNLIAGIDSVTGVLPWREGETFFNVPSNGPAAIMMARTGRLDQAREIVDWIYDNLLADNGLVMDGVRMRMHGPEVVDKTYTYNQGVLLGASLEIVLALRQRAGLGKDEAVDSYDDASKADESITYVTHIRSLMQAIALHMASPQGVILGGGDGDGGLFKGILARYLADIAVRLPEDSPANTATKKVAKRIVLASAESVWNHRLEVDGLPIFSSDWTQDARLPHNYGLGPSTVPEAMGMIRIDERDLSVQLSGWMLLEAAARVSASEED
ncbi:glycoside hydrolase family 76 protein [Corynebacterium lubricantis]|uniref:glycoside hydrolase family 76 protein n=1 Tax=Corynebacterium lubricantis TaxID=541095 RepID=UPI00037D09D4|nr:glycoside hydrolase family 76 protein [Corynebacterium lubricantis]